VRRQVITRALLVAFLISTLGRPAHGEPGPTDPGVPAWAGGATVAADVSSAFNGELPGNVIPSRPPPHLSFSSSQSQPMEPVHAVPTGRPASATEPYTVTQKWWFWTAVGTLLVTTTALLIVATRESSAPRTRLGDMEAFR
jgi:hypothetical protein